MRRVIVDVKVRLILNMEDFEICEVLSEMDYNFRSSIPGVDITGTEILDYEVMDSK